MAEVTIAALHCTATLSRAPTSNLPPCPCACQVLHREATAGLPVKGFKPTWEEGRPTVLPTQNADKNRGFLSYERKPLPYRCVTWPCCTLGSQGCTTRRKVYLAVKETVHAAVSETGQVPSDS